MACAFGSLATSGAIAPLSARKLIVGLPWPTRRLSCTAVPAAAAVPAVAALASVPPAC